MHGLGELHRQTLQFSSAVVEASKVWAVHPPRGNAPTPGSTQLGSRG